jgi:hypothetical protein
MFINCSKEDNLIFHLFLLQGSYSKVQYINCHSLIFGIRSPGISHPQKAVGNLKPSFCLMTPSYARYFVNCPRFRLNFLFNFSPSQ